MDSDFSALLILASGLGAALVVFAGWLIASIWRAPGHITEDNPFDTEE